MEYFHSRHYRRLAAVVLTALAWATLLSQGCGYTNRSLHPENVTSVYVNMFTNRSFRRDIEYELTDALAKRIELQTPYKIVSDINLADTEITGMVEQLSESVLTLQRQTGRALEREVVLTARVSWQNLKTGEMLLDNELVTGSATYSQWQNQGFTYASGIAANNMAKTIVELMEKPW